MARRREHSGAGEVVITFKLRLSATRRVPTPISSAGLPGPIQGSRGEICASRADPCTRVTGSRCARLQGGHFGRSVGRIRKDGKRWRTPGQSRKEPRQVRWLTDRRRRLAIRTARARRRSFRFLRPARERPPAYPEREVSRTGCRVHRAAPHRLLRRRASGSELFRLSAPPKRCTKVTAPHFARRIPRFLACPSPERCEHGARRRRGQLSARSCGSRGRSGWRAGSRCSSRTFASASDRRGARPDPRRDELRVSGQRGLVEAGADELACNLVRARLHALGDLHDAPADQRKTKACVSRERGPALRIQLGQGRVHRSSWRTWAKARDTRRSRAGRRTEPAFIGRRRGEWRSSSRAHRRCRQSH